MDHDELTGTRLADHTNTNATAMTDVNRKLKNAIEKLKTLERVDLVKQQTSHHSFGLPGLEEDEEAPVVRDRFELKLRLADDYELYCQVIFDSHDYFFPPDIVFRKGILPPLRTDKQQNSDVIRQLTPIVKDWDLSDENCLYRWVERILFYLERNATTLKPETRANEINVDEWAFLSSIPDEPTTRNKSPATSSTVDNILDKIQRSKHKSFKQKVLSMTPSKDNDDFDFQTDTIHFPRSKESRNEGKAVEHFCGSKRREDSSSSTTKSTARSAAKRSSDQIDESPNNDIIDMTGDDDFVWEPNRQPSAQSRTVYFDDDDDATMTNSPYPRQQQQQRHKDVDRSDSVGSGPPPLKRPRKPIRPIIGKDSDNGDDDRTIDYTRRRGVSRTDWTTNASWRKRFVTSWLETHRNDIAVYDASGFKSFALYKTFKITDGNDWERYVAFKRQTTTDFKRKHNIIDKTVGIVKPLKRLAPMLIKFSMNKDVPHSKLHIRLVSVMNTVTTASAMPDFVDFEYEIDRTKSHGELVSSIMSFLTEKSCKFHLFQDDEDPLKMGEIKN